MLRSIGKHPCQACGGVNCVDIRRRDRADIVRAGRRLRRGRHAHSGRGGHRARYSLAVVKVDRMIRWHYTTTILRLRIGARLTRYRNCKFHNFALTISRHADGISRYSVPPSAGPLLPLLISKP